jgi:hypothetical protein
MFTSFVKWPLPSELRTAAARGASEHSSFAVKCENKFKIMISEYHERKKNILEEENDKKYLMLKHLISVPVRQL